MNSYVVKTKSSGMRNVLLLQTTNPAHYAIQDYKKSLLVTRYMTTLRVELTYPIKEWGHTTKYKTRKWTLVALSYVHDMAHINRQAIYVINNAKEDVDSFEFG